MDIVFSYIGNSSNYAFSIAMSNAWRNMMKIQEKSIILKLQISEKYVN